MSALVISRPGPAVAAPTPRRAGTERPTPATGLRLTRRGRMLLLGLPALAVTAVLVFSLLAVLLGSLASPAKASTRDAGAGLGGPAAVTVLQGDSLWSIAAASAGTRDVRDVVADIVSLNNLGSSVLQAGQRLYVPLPE
ncbi:LysM peptidoglycan-binding domain-containing protein [Arthrobacter sp. STN4]|uniref:LysM peptidoglycan-binding domain-containing protein n=1 Tax=Arthrobacter sp. STN4 TaxID=2923276 RepID=UPI00211A33D1|nr:LysM peptidoglycan-binding domain-containing protein [Arthrobacter sp. STN4]MCQ9165687.1 LysM peptidoglycan-binding domain-containing protein [Arthrobacter sp. STN4]